MILLFVISLVILYALFIGMFIFGFARISNECHKNKPPISIIVAVRNECATIDECIRALVSQTYPRNLREIIIVDDGSTDRTPVILTELSNMFMDENINVLTRANSSGNKKAALQLGIEQAHGDILLLTDADCVPRPAWAETIVSHFTDSTGMVVGFSPLLTDHSSFFGNLIKIDSLFAALFSAAGIGLNTPLTATGRNIAWRRSLFSEVDGFQTIMKSMSGDDDLFMHLISKRTEMKIRYSLLPESVVPSYQQMSFKDFLHQKSRHISASKYYPLGRQLIYGLFHMLNFGLHGFTAIALILQQHVIIVSTLLISTYIMDWFFLRIGAKTFSMQIGFLYVVYWEWLFIFYNIVSGLRVLFRSISWK